MGGDGDAAEEKLAVKKIRRRRLGAAMIFGQLAKASSWLKSLAAWLRNVSGCQSPDYTRRTKNPK